MHNNIKRLVDVVFSGLCPTSKKFLISENKTVQKTDKEPILKCHQR